jgi:2'-5' RNA ligase
VTRCFVGLELDDGSRAYLDSVVRPVHRALQSRGRWPMRLVRPENWHLTLLFFPDLDEDGRAAVWETIERGASAGAWRDAAFDWRGLALWPSERRPSLIALEAAPYAPAERWPFVPLLGREPFSRADTRHVTPFRPHITVIRFDPRWRKALPEAWAHALRDAPAFDPARIRFDRVSFLLSTLGPEQPVYPRERTVGF